MQKVQGWVEQGNTTLTIGQAAGVIARKVQGSYPGATVTVYLNNASAVAISSISRTSNVVTVTIPSGSGFIAGEQVTIAGVTDASFNGTFTIVSSGATTFTYAQTAGNASSSGGTASSTLRLATIYSDNSSTAKANPFVSASDGTWFFYAPNGHYDVKFSGTGISAPFTLGDLFLDDGSLAFINVTQPPYSATGNGVTDDTAAVQAAVNALSSGGMIFFPVGQYKLLTAVSLSGKTKISIVGTGAGSVILKSGTNTRAFDCQNSSKIVIRNLQFLGDFDTYTGSSQGSQGAVVTDNSNAANFCDDLVVTQCFFTNLCADAIRFGPNSRRGRVTDNNMNGGLGFVEMSGVDAGADVRKVLDITIATNTLKSSVSSPRNGGVGVTGSDDMIDAFGAVEGINIFGNDFDHGGTTSTTTQVNRSVLLLPTASGSVKTATVHGNVCRNVQSDGSVSHSAINLDASQANDGLENVTVSNNSFYNCHQAIHVDSSNKAVSVSGNVADACRVAYRFGVAHNATILNNEARLPLDKGFFVQGNYVNCSYNRCLIDSAITGDKTAFWITSGDDNIIVGNVASGAGPAGSFLMRFLGNKARTRCAQNLLTLDALGTGLQILGAGNTVTRLWMNDITGNGTNISDSGTSTLYGDTQPPTTFALVPAASSSLEGVTWPVTDSSTAVFGAVITGGGANHVLAYCDGTNWRVAGSSTAVTPINLTTGVTGVLPIANGGTAGNTAAAARTALGFASSTYTPTLTNIANLDGSTAYQCQYMQVGSVVAVSGKVDVNPTTGGLSTQLGISIPIASTISFDYQGCGAANASGIAGQSAAIFGDGGNNRVKMQWIAGDVSNQGMYFSFIYLVS